MRSETSTIAYGSHNMYSCNCKQSYRLHYSIPQYYYSPSCIVVFILCQGYHSAILHMCVRCQLSWASFHTTNLANTIISYYYNNTGVKITHCGSSFCKLSKMFKTKCVHMFEQSKRFRTRDDQICNMWEQKENIMLTIIVLVKPEAYLLICVM